MLKIKLKTRALPKENSSIPRHGEDMRSSFDENIQDYIKEKQPQESFSAVCNLQLQVSSTQLSPLTLL